MEHGRHRWQQHEHVTLTDVAKEAGVSQSAASVVLNGAQSGTRVSASRRKLVMETAERMGYRPNALARSLITGRTNLIGIYSGRCRLESRNAFFAEILGGVFEGAAEYGANAVVHTSGFGKYELLELVSNRKLDGLIVHAGGDDPILRMVQEFRAPAVAVADVVEHLPNVVVDDVTGGTLQAQHLAACGHRNVMLKIADWETISMTARRVAFIESAERLGIQCHVRPETFEENDGLDPADIRLITEGSERVTAVVGYCDDNAQRICAKLAALGIAIPSEVAVMGFDGFRYAYPPRFQITTIRAPWAEVGRTAARLVMSLVENDSVPLLTTLPVEFVRGTTT